MGTEIIAQLQHSEIPALRVEIIAQPRISGPGSIYMVTRQGGGIDGKYLFNYLSCGRLTEAEARKEANFLWADAVQRVRKHQQAGQSDPFEIVGAAEVVDELMATTPAEVDSRPALVFPEFKLEDGQLHEHKSEVYKISVSAKGYPYASKLMNREGKPVWQYTPGIANNLSALTLMTKERQSELGRIMTYCVNCGAHLTHPVSIERGMGPVCYGKAYDEN